ncbi:MAG: ACP S-malonyltransferase, partial [Alphaproteobacteria bacterium]|nr:ACP S-malonyltransferase [Alphaproteobacteria bacterium]
GQGSQAVGMGKELADAFTVAKEVFLEVDDALSEHLSKKMFEGPAEDLLLTENAQPALMAVSMAVVRILQQEGKISLSKTFKYAAGHSLGEYSALCAAGAFDITMTAKLLRTRGKAMQQAVPVGKGGMAALIGADLEQAKAIAEEAAQGDVCVAANDNAPGQVVLSGTMAAIDRAVEIAAKKEIKRAVKLAVSAPFHSPLMKPAADVMAQALAEVEIKEPRFPVIANVTARPVTDPAEIRKLLVEQVTGSVRWRESVLFAVENGVDTLAEAGSGKVLTGMAKRIHPELKGIALNTPRDIEDFLKTL